MVKAVIFDMDGVLVDSQPFHFDVDYQVLLRNGVNIPAEITHNYAGMSNRDRWSKYIKDFDLPLSAGELIDTHVKTIMELLEKSDLKPIPGVLALLGFLKSRGVLLSVASSSSYDFIYKMLDKLEIRDYFHYVLSGEDMKNSKPAPDIFIKSAAVLGLLPEDCVVIEDSASGVLAAKGAGIKCVGYYNPNSGSQDLSPSDIIIDHFYTLIEDPSWLL